MSTLGNGDQYPFSAAELKSRAEDSPAASAQVAKQMAASRVKEAIETLLYAMNAAEDVGVTTEVDLNSQSIRTLGSSRPVRRWSAEYAVKYVIEEGRV